MMTKTGEIREGQTPRDEDKETAKAGVKKSVESQDYDNDLPNQLAKRAVKSK